jgi:predicted dehydrogenase
MSQSAHPSPSRRQFIQTSGRVAAASALAGVALPHVHAGENNTIQLALIGCGGRGAGAVANAMSAGGLVVEDLSGRQASPGERAAGTVKLVAMADIRQDRLDEKHKILSETLGEAVDVPPERRFLGFDAYRHAIDCLKPGDIALLTTFSSFRAQHFEYAVSKGVNVFMEKTFGPDPASLHRLLKANEEAEKKGLKVACGLMCRHSSSRQALIEQIRGGAIGDVMNIRAYRMDPGYFMGPYDKSESEVLWQLAPGKAYQFMWASGGIFVELMIHQMDECFWIKDSYPVSAHGVGGRFSGSTDASQNFDSYAVEFTFADGSKANVTGRYIPNCHNEFATYLHGTKCAAKFSGDVHRPECFIYENQQTAGGKVAWKPGRERVNPWQAEWDVLLEAVRSNKPHNELKRAAYSNLGAIMGRSAVHMGRIITWDEMMSSRFAFAASADHLDPAGPAPVQADADGRYPVPMQGKWIEV